MKQSISRVVNPSPVTLPITIDVHGAVLNTGCIRNTEMCSSEPIFVCSARLKSSVVDRNFVLNIEGAFSKLVK